ncbi:MAG: M1 family aminopeptidase [Bacteroidota bacterium]
MTRFFIASASLILLIFAANLHAQEIQSDDFKLSESRGSSWQGMAKESSRLASKRTSQSSGVILRYQLDLNFTDGLTNNSHFYSGRERITWRPNGDSLVILDAIDLRVDSVLNESQRLLYDTQSSNGELKIVLPPPMRTHDSLLVDIWYAHTSPNEIGYYYYDKNPAGGTLERLGYTMTEPDDSPYWFPCLNDPSVKVPCRINVTVPRGYLAASNGVLKQTIDNGDGTLSFQWEERHPIAMYLMAVTISKYSTFSHFYHRVSNPSESVEIKYYIWQADSAGETYNAVAAFKNVVDMVTFYSTIFGEYPFDKYGMAAVYPFNAGGMEHQTITTIHRSWLADGGSQNGIAHELAHQWWGDMVTCGTWADIWLNEGFATYCAALWEDHFPGMRKLKDLMASIQHFTDGSWQNAIYNPPGYLFGDVEYSKGAWVLHMLRYVLGDSTFFNVFKTYRQRFEYKSATTDDFATVTSSVAGRDMSWFFNQWVYRKGWPIYAYQWNSSQESGGAYNLTVGIQQQQTDSVFQMPIQLVAVGAGRDTTLTANDSLRKQSFSFVIPFRPDSVFFDRDGWILKRMAQFATNVGTGDELPTSFFLYQNYPNPFNPTTIISYYLPLDGTVALKIYDPLGREVRTLVNRQELAGYHETKFDGKGLTSGVYFYRVMVTPSTATAGVFVDTKKMLLLK